MSESKQQHNVIVVLGATGAQGGGLVDEILKYGKFSVRAITRDVNSAAAKALAARGVEVVVGDVDDAASLAPAFAGAWGLYVVTNYWAHGSTDRETAQLRAIADASKKAGIKHQVVSTLEDTTAVVKDGDFTLVHGLPVPHFDVKGKANAFFEQTGIPTAFLYTTFYYQNFVTFGLNANGDGTYSITMPLGSSKLQMVDVRDIGRAAYALFDGTPSVGNWGVAGADLPVAEIAAIMSKELGKTIKYQEVPTEVFASFPFPGAQDMANMYKYYRDYPNDFAKLRSVKGSAYLAPYGGVRDFTSFVREYKDALLAKLV